ncbi:S-layer homology domain-containing protein, partial [Paenibacillus sp. N4]|uniref:S-layer homology domain-containing protein n=1 Tax=Paenibacillus vietnamensis TaxID=2590547 RepID=UPI001CD1911D
YLLMLMRALELDNAAEGQEATAAAFVDTNTESYYSEALALAKALGIVKGDLNNRFRPDDSITRQEAIVMAQRAMAAAGIELPPGDAANMQFRDSQDISSYAKDGVAALVEAGVIRGYDGYLHPNQLLTRAQAAVMIRKVMN